MHCNDQDLDLRMLTLLHAMRDTEGFVQEAERLKKSKAIDSSTWQRICDMGRELIPADALFAAHNDGADSEDGDIFDRRKRERRVRPRRVNADRREQDRRTAVMPWLGLQRRRQQRRQHMRRQDDFI